MKSKQFSTVVSASCLIAFMFMCAVVKCTGQNSVIQTSRITELKADPAQSKVQTWKQEYKSSLTRRTYLTWGMFATAGIMWGAREAYHAEPTVFERRFNAGKTSWWGSEQWKRNYWGNNPDNGHKPEYFGNVGRDMWHTFGAGSKLLIMGGTVTIGTGKAPRWTKIVNGLAGVTIQSIAASITYNALR